MRFLTDSEDAGYLAQALIHYNHALDEMSSRRATETTKSLFDGLNNLQTAWSREHADFVCGEVRTFREMIVTGLDASESSELVRSSEFRAFALLEPPVMNHQTLKDGGYRPDQETPAGLRKKASEEHHKLANAYVCTQDDPTEENDQRAVRWATEVLYIVRSNIAHGEKTSFGPDTEKVARDEQVCGAVVPVQLLLFQLLLDRPETKLISYGTLAPGQPNHEVLSGLSGEWASCITRGNKGVVDGFPAFWWDPHGPEVEVQVLTSPGLPAFWSRLDEFEGGGYRRILAPYTTVGRLGVASVYESTSRQPVDVEVAPTPVLEARQEEGGSTVSDTPDEEVDYGEIRRQLSSLLVEIGSDRIGAAERPRGGADVLITSKQPVPSGPGAFYPDPRFVVTDHELELSWLFESLRDIFYSAIDGCTKIEFYGRLANAADRFLSSAAGGPYEVRHLLLAVTAEASQMLDEMESGTFEYLAIAPGGLIADDLAPGDKPAS